SGGRLSPIAIGTDREIHGISLAADSKNEYKSAYNPNQSVTDFRSRTADCGSNGLSQEGSIVKAVFVDANEALTLVMTRLLRDGDPETTISRDPDVKPEALPGLLQGAEIAIIDHTHFPTNIARECVGLKHVVFLGTGPGSYMNVQELA